MTLISIQNQYLHVEISTRGAELQSIRDSSGNERLWQGDPAFWTGRAQILFPICGGLREDTYYLDGQRYSMPYPELKAILTDIGTEELGHLEMIGTIVYQLTRNLSPEEIKAAGMDAYFVDHTTGIYPSSAAGVPFTAAYIQSKGDVLTDLHEDLAAEQKL